MASICLQLCSHWGDNRIAPQVGMASVVKKVEALGFPFNTLDPFLCPRRPGAVKRPSHFPMYIGFVWRFCMGAQGA
jgi:hypothetical protein